MAHQPDRDCIINAAGGRNCKWEFRNFTKAGTLGGSFDSYKMEAAEADTPQHGTQPHNASHNPSEDHWSIVLKKLGAHSDASAEAASDAPCELTSILHNRILHNVTFLMQRLLATTKLHSGSRSSSARLSSR